MSPFKTRWTFLKGYVLLNFELTNNGYFALDFIVSKAISVFYVPSNRVQRAKQAVMLSTTEKKANKKFLKQVEVWKITSTTGSLLPLRELKQRWKPTFHLWTVYYLIGLWSLPTFLFQWKQYISVKCTMV